MTPRAREHRFRRLKEMGCYACWSQGVVWSQPEIHHLNFDGKAGQKRRGDECTVPLCRWHHQGDTYGYTQAEMYEAHGPSLKLHSREFRAKYGSDDEILRHVDDLIRQLDELASVHHRSEAERSV